MALTTAGEYEKARAASDGLLAAADVTDNPHSACFALLAWGMAHRYTDPAGASDVLQRGLAIARSSENQQIESVVAFGLSMFANSDDNSSAASDYLAKTIRRRYDTGRLAYLHAPLAILAIHLHRLGRCDSAATLAGFAANSPIRASTPELEPAITQLRDVLGTRRYDALTRTGANMTNADITAYALEQIDQAKQDP